MTKIAGPENRAITVKELITMWLYVEKHADRNGELTGWYDRSRRNYGKPLRIDTINLYQLCDWVVIPATARASCSFVDLLRSNETRASAENLTIWFVSHWHGEPDCLSEQENYIQLHGEKETLPEFVQRMFF